MALTNPKIFGLAVESKLTDVKNKNLALQNIGINPLDLDIIRGATNAGMTRFDWISFSRLSVPLYKTLDRFNRESNAFSNILEERAGIDQTLFGNLNINGSISGSAIRYRFIDFSDGNKTKIADISTSRVSAWSSSDPRANNQNLETQKLARISYGARIGIVEDGKLVFGKQSTATKAIGNASSTSAVQQDPEGNDILGPANQPRLQTTIVPESVEFPSEVPTSVIKCKIPNPNTGSMEIVSLYTMKGIPLVFKGFFKNLNATVRVSNSNPRVSWKIVETANENLYSNYKNKGTATSTIRFRSPVSRERFIKIYKNPNEITSVQIRSATLRELPSIKLKECTVLDFFNNQIKTFPNFKFITPKLTSLQLGNNPLHLSDIEDERNLNLNILNKIKDVLTSFNLGGTFSGSIERNIISEKLPKLSRFDIGRSGGKSFNQDNRPTGNTQVRLMSGNTLQAPTTGNNEGTEAFCPDVPDGVTFYSISRNSFRSVDRNAIPAGGTVNDVDGNPVSYPNGSFSFKMLPNLVELNCFANEFLDDVDSGGDTTLKSASENKIEVINYSSTDLGIPTNLTNCTSLKRYESTYNGGAVNTPMVNNSTGSYLFDNCTSLERIRFYATDLGQINFPNKFTNPKLQTLDIRLTNIKGGKPQIADASQTHVIHSDTFEDAIELRDLYIQSRYLLEKDIDPQAFTKNTKLTNFRYYSYGRSTGSISALFGNNALLRTVYMVRNAFDGSPPNFASNSLIRIVQLQFNKLNGTIPAYTNLNSLRFLYLNNNELTVLSEFGLLPGLIRFYAHNNQIGGEIPDFSGCNNLRNLTLHRNQFTAYKKGALSKLYKIKYIDLSFNKLSQTSLNNILLDLLENWNSIKRGGVTVNLKSQNGGVIPTPFGAGMDAAKTLSNNGWSIGISGGIQSNL